MTASGPPLTTPGVWAFTDSLAAPVAADLAHLIEALGYSTLWLPETLGRDPFAHIGFLADRTETLVFATGIANVYHRHPGVMKQGANTVAEQSGGRVLLGLGVSHERTVSGIRGLDYSRPLSFMRGYLDAYESAVYAGPNPTKPVSMLLAALGPKMMALAAEQGAGVHPYSTTPAHTAQARAVLGPGPLLCVEQKVVLTDDRQAGLELARRALKRIIGLPNYQRCWLSLGFTERGIVEMRDEFVSGIIAIGDEAAIAERVQAHYDAGATQVCINPLNAAGSSDPDLVALERLAAVLL